MSEQRYEQLAAFNQTFVWEVDLTGLCTYISPGVEQVLGYHPDEIVGKLGVADLAPEEDKQRFKRHFQESLASQRPFRHLEYALTAKCGDIIWVSRNGLPIFDDAGEPLGYRGTDTDITEQRQVARALLDSEQRYAMLFHQMLEGSALKEVLYDDLGHPRDYRILAVNPAFVSITGLTEDGVLGQTVLDTFPDLQPDWATILADVASSGQPQTFELYLASLQKHLQVTAFCPVRGQLACTFADITERKRAEAELSLLSEQLAQAQRLEAVGLLAGGVAHDFNNLSMGLMGYAESALERLGADHPARKDILEILRSADHGATMTTQLLAFARRQAIVLRTINLNEAVGDVLELLNQLVGENMSVVWQPAPELWSVRLDPGQTTQLLSNLCINAREATDGVGTLTITTANLTFYEQTDGRSVPPGDYVSCSITDDGRGMTAEVMDRIFDPFYTTKGVGEGSGLGLATVYGIVKQNDGFISVTSKPGHGTTFVVSFPRYLGSDSGDEAESALDYPVGGKETVLLVDDETGVRTLTTRMLQRLGYHVLVAEDPLGGIAMAREHPGPIALLVTDVIMPVMTGKAMAEKIAELHHDLRVLYISGYTADVIASRGVIDADVHFLAKPFTRDALGDKIRDILSSAP